MLAQEKNVVRLTERLSMTIAVDFDVKPQIKQSKTLALGQVSMKCQSRLKQKTYFVISWFLGK